MNNKLIFIFYSEVETAGKIVGGIPTSEQMHTSKVQRHASRGALAVPCSSEVERDGREERGWHPVVFICIY